MKYALLLSGLICVALLVYAPIETFMLQEYHDHQRAYRQLLQDADGGDAQAYPIEIRQIVLADLQRIDRCVSCHVGMEDPRMVDAPQPLTTHPGDYLIQHDVQKIGCTVCHDGQGRALTQKDAHAVAEGVHWEKPILSPPFLEANCLRCHDLEELPGLETVNHGRDVFQSKGCLGCHKLEGQGGQLAPDLTNVADASTELKRPTEMDHDRVLSEFHGNKNLAYIFESIENPDAQPSTTAMIDYQFSEEDAIALTVYLKGLSKRDVPASYLHKRQHSSRPEDLRGGALYAKYCIACHGEGGKGGVENRNYARNTVPPLNTLAEKMFLEYQEDAEYLSELLLDGVDIEAMDPPPDVEGLARVLAQFRAIKDVIKNGSAAPKADPDGPAPLLHMPSWTRGLGDEQIDSIIGYLLGEYDWEDDDV